MGLPLANNSAADIRTWAEVAAKRSGTGMTGMTGMDILDRRPLGVSTAADTAVSNREVTGAGARAGARARAGAGAGGRGNTGSGTLSMAGTGEERGGP